MTLAQLVQATGASPDEVRAALAQWVQTHPVTPPPREIRPRRPRRPCGVQKGHTWNAQGWCQFCGVERCLVLLGAVGAKTPVRCAMARLVCGYHRKDA